MGVVGLRGQSCRLGCAGTRAAVLAKLQIRSPIKCFAHFMWLLIGDCSLSTDSFISM